MIIELYQLDLLLSENFDSNSNHASKSGYQLSQVPNHHSIPNDGRLL